MGGAGAGKSLSISKAIEIFFLLLFHLPPGLLVLLVLPELS